MSISTPGGPERRPTVVSTGKKPAAGRPSAGAKAGSGKPAGNARTGGKGPRKPVAPVKVSQGRSWGPIALFAAVGLIAVGIIGYGGWAVYNGAKPWNERAEGISGLVDFRETQPDLVKG